ncbi:hypothetical protein SAMN04489752_2491 [Brevibacterium siliguriense]|uniref:DUF6993 domain-containing protein n=1 Tax=Brevibacterium siliguriense TaxID=1136497 RepID=A0A1H1UYW2_9MICO|nr:hypothetical protein [Brevibacterium siliguriense]SDS77738.1 hypothetical protein SAMN04489752_2491 [Brevibacterium siliguriense]
MRLVPVLGAAALTLALSGCSLLGFGADDSQPEPKQTQAKPVAEVDKVLKALKPLTGDKESVPSTKKFFSTMVDAGYDPEQLEATIDESPLGNEVPSKMFGVKTDKGCVVGEIRKGKAAADLVEPTESTGSCLFGEVERPKGVKAPKGEKRDEDGDSNGAGHMPGEDINGKDGETESPTPSEADSESSSIGEAEGSASSEGAEGTDSSEGTAGTSGETSSEGGSGATSSEADTSDEAPSLGGG